MKVKLNLIGLDGNAFALMAAFHEAARRQKMPAVEAAAVIEECIKGDYDHLLRVLMDHTEPEDPS